MRLVRADVARSDHRIPALNDLMLMRITDIWQSPPLSIGLGALVTWEFHALITVGPRPT